MEPVRNSNAKSSERTLLSSVILSLPGPLVVGLGLILGRSSTQLADFIRRSAELIAIIVSWLTFRVLHRDKEYTLSEKERLERIAHTCVGAAMCISGTAMLFIALFSSHTDKGNVIPGLIIAVLGVLTNGFFWHRYRKLDRENPNAILSVQSKLYRAKTFVDTCVMLALSVIVIAPHSQAAFFVDIIGSVIVAGYLVFSGITTLRAIPEK